MSVIACCDGCKGVCGQGGVLQGLCSDAWDAEAACDFDAAINLFKTAIDYGCSVAMVELGIMFEGAPVQETIRKFYWENEETCDDFARHACREYLNTSMPDLPFVNEEIAIEYYRMAALRGDRKGMRIYASKLLCGNIKVKRPYPFVDVDTRFCENSERYNADEAVLLLRLLEKKRLELHEVYSLLGQAYDYGWGVEQNYAKAMEYYGKSAALGSSWASSWAAMEIGVLTFLGWGGSSDYARAFYWFRRAMHGGCDYAALNAAYCYETGQGTSQDITAAVNLYKQVLDCEIDVLVKRAKEGLGRCG
jgi:hypothetical protein